MKNLLIISVVLLVLIAGACVYTDNEIYAVEPEPGDPPTISVTTNLDTIPDPTVVDSLGVSFLVNLENGRLYLVDVLLNNTVVFSEDTTMGTFWLRNSLVETPGNDTLYMNVYYSTNSNSLADLFGVEANTLSIKYPIKFEGGAR
jgi:hypothetical protein